jgi:hypothetical protein
MTQNASDVEIANQGFAAFRQDLNDVLEDITTLHSGNTAPTTTYANQWWYETDTDKLYIRNEDNDAWIEILTLDQANDHLATIGASITLDGTGNVSIDSGDFTVDTDTLYVDSTNNRVGVGTVSPSALLNAVDASGSGTTTQIASGTAHSQTRFAARTEGYNGIMSLYDSGGTEDVKLSAKSGQASYINNGGNVGIGTDSPAHELTVKNATQTPTIRIHSDTTSFPSPRLEFIRGTNDTFGGDNYSDHRIVADSGHLIFQEASSGTTNEVMRLDNSGGLLLNVTSKNANSQAAIKASSTIAIQTQPTSNGYYPLYFYNASGQQRGYIFTSSTSTSFNTTSDYRLKENVIGVTDGIERVKQLNPSRFNFIADADTTVDGFLAHEVSDIVPEAITGEKDAMQDEEYEVTPAVYEDVVIPAVLDDDGNEIEPERTKQQLVTEAVMGTRSVPDYQGIDQAKLVPLLTAALQEAIAKIEDLETRVAALEN